MHHGLAKINAPQLLHECQFFNSLVLPKLHLILLKGYLEQYWPKGFEYSMAGKNKIYQCFTLTHWGLRTLDD